MPLRNHIYRWPQDAELDDLMARLVPRDDGMPPSVVQSARAIISDVRRRGNAAVLDATARFDGHVLTVDQVVVTRDEIDESAEKCDQDVCDAIERAIENVRTFHEPQLPSAYTVSATGGATLSFAWRPVEAAGLYVPGGRAAYPSTVVMNAVPAQVAGVDRLVVFTVPGMVEQNPAVAYALQTLGLDEVYRVGGVQAIAIAAYGTETIDPVDVVVGPGNAYVTAAKREVFGRVGIDSLAGPSEVLILADESAPPAYVAADLLAQAEHDPRARSIVATTSEAHADAIAAALRAQVEQAPRREILEPALSDHGAILIVEDHAALVEISRLVAAEHLQWMVDAPAPTDELICGALFVGNETPTAIGDYIAGPNHVLPTGRAARFAAPLNVTTFLRGTSAIEGSAAMIRELGPLAARLADHEGLHGHAAALRARFEKGSA